MRSSPGGNFGPLESRFGMIGFSRHDRLLENSVCFIFSARGWSSQRPFRNGSVTTGSAAENRAAARQVMI